jgi:hypothetical protein
LRARDLLGQLGVLRMIKADEVNPAKMDNVSLAEIQIRAAGTISLRQADQVLYHVMDLESPSKI